MSAYVHAIRYNYKHCKSSVYFLGPKILLHAHACRLRLNQNVIQRHRPKPVPLNLYWSRFINFDLKNYLSFQLKSINYCYNHLQTQAESLQYFRSRLKAPTSVKQVVMRNHSSPNLFTILNTLDRDIPISSAIKRTLRPWLCSSSTRCSIWRACCSV